MPNIAKLRPHTDAVIQTLEAAGLLVLDGGPDPNQPKNWAWEAVPGQSKYRAHVIVHPLPGGVFDGPLGCPDDDASLTWQATCVAETRQRCEWVADEVLAALVGQQLTVEGRSVPRLYADMPGGGARRHDTVQPPVYIATPRFRAMSTPA